MQPSQEKNLDLLATRQTMGGSGTWVEVEGQDTAEDLAGTFCFGPEVKILDFWGENSKNKQMRFSSEGF